jgi:RNA polymerase sigma-70 factor, ECF subfamily
MGFDTHTHRSDVEHVKNTTDTDTDPPSDTELVARARNADSRAMELLIRRYHDRIYRVVYSMTAGDEDEALDLTQDVFLSAFRNIGGYRGTSSYYTWIYRIAINACLDARRHRSRWLQIFPFRRRKDTDDRKAALPDLEEMPEPSGMTDPLVVLRNKELHEQVRHALKALPRKQRLVFQFKVFQEMTIVEIAGVMNLAEGTVKSHLFRATRTLRKTLSPNNSYPGR